MNPPANDWPALEAARRRILPRVPFQVDGQAVGSVAVAHLQALRAWPDVFQVSEQAVDLRADARSRESALARVHDALRAQGLIRAWRDEAFPLYGADGRQILVRIERAAACPNGEQLVGGTTGTGVAKRGIIVDDQIRRGGASSSEAAGKPSICHCVHCQHTGIHHHWTTKGAGRTIESQSARSSFGDSETKQVIANGSIDRKRIGGIHRPCLIRGDPQRTIDHMGT